MSYKGAVNATIMPNYRAVAFKNMTAAQSGMDRPIGFIDFETEDGNMLLGISFGIQIFMLWNACLCWSAGGIGLNIVSDAEAIVRAKEGRINKREPLDINNIPLSGHGAGQYPYYSR